MPTTLSVCFLLTWFFLDVIYAATFEAPPIQPGNH